RRPRRPRRGRAPPRQIPRGGGSLGYHWRTMPKDCPTEIPSLHGDDEGEQERTEMRSFAPPLREKRPFLVQLSGVKVGLVHRIDAAAVTIGRAPSCDLEVDGRGISRVHARLVRGGEGAFAVEDMGSSNG